MSLYVSCTSLAGTSSGTEAKMAGVIVDDKGAPAPHSIVRLVLDSFDPVNGIQNDTLLDTTDEQGAYSIPDVDAGTYNVEIVNPTTGANGLVRNVVVDKKDVMLPQAVITKPGTVRVSILTAVDTANGYFFIKGTNIAKRIHDPNVVFIDSVPAGTMPALFYTLRKSESDPISVCPSFEVKSQDTALILFGGWTFTRKITLNTSATGADVVENFTKFPVLVRLNSTNFDFSQASKNGADILFTGKNDRRLPFEIERWDSAAGLAEIWVNVDTVFGNNATQFINMFWGNPRAVSASNSETVFDTANNYLAVWHFNQAATDTVKDATADHYSGIPHAVSAASESQSLIGQAKRFDGVSSYIAMPGTANSRLNLPEKGIYSISAWVNMDTLDGQMHILASKGNNQFNLQVMYSYNTWEFAECMAAGGYTMVSSPASTHVWALVMGVRNGDKQYIYVNGICTDSTITTGNPTFIRSTGDDFTIGKRTDALDSYFKGQMDEVRVSNCAYAPGYAKLCYMNQKKPDALVQFK